MAQKVCLQGPRSQSGHRSWRAAFRQPAVWVEADQRSQVESPKGHPPNVAVMQKQKAAGVSRRFRWKQTSLCARFRTTSLRRKYPWTQPQQPPSSPAGQASNLSPALLERPAVAHDTSSPLPPCGRGARGEGSQTCWEWHQTATGLSALHCWRGQQWHPRVRFPCGHVRRVRQLVLQWAAEAGLSSLSSSTAVSTSFSPPPGWMRLLTVS